MQQVLLPPAQPPTIDGHAITTGVVNLVIESQIVLRLFDDSIPVKVIDNKLQVNEKLLEDKKIYSLKHNGQEYFVRRHSGATEIFQLA